jgi:hypothetical protein
LQFVVVESGFQGIFVIWIKHWSQTFRYWSWLFGIKQLFLIHWEQTTLPQWGQWIWYVKISLVS